MEEERSLPPVASTEREAIERYCDEKGIDIPELTVSGEKEVSAVDPAWEVDYAFPGEQESLGVFFLLHETDGEWTVVAHTDEVGWTSAELQALGALPIL